MKQARKGRVFRFPFFKNLAYAYKKCFECAPVATFIFISTIVLVNIVTGFSPLLLSKIVGIVEGGNVSASMNIFTLYICLYIIIRFYRWFSNIPINRFHGRTRMVKIMPYHSKIIFEKLTKVKYGFFYSKDFADNQTLVYDATSYLCIVPHYASNICGSFIGVVILVATLGVLNVWIMLLSLLPTALQFYFNFKNASKDYSLSKEAEKLSRQLSRYSTILENYRGIRETKANQSNEYVFDKWEENLKKYQKTTFRKNMSWTKVNIACSLLETVTLIGVVALSVFLIFKGQMKVAAFAGILSASGSVFSRTRSIASDFGWMRKGTLFVDAYRRFVESKDIEESNSNVKKEKFESLEFCDVSFAYPEYGFKEGSAEVVLKEQENPKMVLDSVSFKINKGERIAIVGENGSGKTTITKLIAKLYEPVSGKILFNGKPLNEANLEGYRENFSVINQEFAHYSLPLCDAVLAGTNKKLSNKQVERALKEAGANDVLESANEHQGLSTWLTREFDGMELSGGQKQKVSIARGFAGASEVMMVDEPTSALDPLVEKKILDNILKATEGKTAIVISHRLSLCTKMDRILYIENGKIVEDGPHSKLMKIKNGKYRQLFGSQAKWYE